MIAQTQRLHLLLTDNAGLRMQQPRVDPRLIDGVITFGSRSHSHRSRTARETVERLRGSAKSSENSPRNARQSRPLLRLNLYLATHKAGFADVEYSNLPYCGSAFFNAPSGLRRFGRSPANGRNLGASTTARLAPDVEAPLCFRV